MVVRLRTCIRTAFCRNLGRMSEHSGRGFMAFLSPTSQLWDSTISARMHHSKFFQLHHSPVIDDRQDMVCDMLLTASQKNYGNKNVH